MREIVHRNAKPKLRGYYWKENQLLGNLGDALTPLVIAALGYELIPQTTDGAVAINEGHCFLGIGSLLAAENLARFTGPLDIWGGGWRGVCPPPTLLAQARIYAVRGPQTVTGLGLPADTPLGDPALLLPHLLPHRIRSHGRTVVVPHLHRLRLMSAEQRCRLTGCAEMVTTQVIQRQGIGRSGWQRQSLVLIKNWLCYGARPSTRWGAIARIAGADFVLTGSLHGAILAQAYSIPWAAYDDGYVDVPAKWLDWAAYLGVQLQFVTTLAAGQQWWRYEGQRGVVRDLHQLLEAFPYSKVTT